MYSLNLHMTAILADKPYICPSKFSFSVNEIFKRNLSLLVRIDAIDSSV